MMIPQKVCFLQMKCADLLAFSSATTPDFVSSIQFILVVAEVNRLLGGGQLGITSIRFILVVAEANCLLGGQLGITC